MEVGLGWRRDGCRCCPPNTSLTRLVNKYRPHKVPDMVFFYHCCCSTDITNYYYHAVNSQQSTLRSAQLIFFFFDLYTFVIIQSYISLYVVIDKLKGSNCTKFHFYLCYIKVVNDNNVQLCSDFW